MPKAILIILVLSAAFKTAKAEYGGVFIKYELNLKSGEKKIGYHEYSGYIDEFDTLFVDGFMPLSFLFGDQDSVRLYADMITYKYNWWYSENPMMQRGVAKPFYVATNQIVSVIVLKMYSFSYMMGFGTSHSLADSVWMKTPVVDTASSGTLFGTASRDMLCTLLKRKAFGSPDALSAYNESGLSGVPKRLSPLVQWDTLERVYPRYPTIDDVEMRSADRNCLLDLRPYANTAPYTVNETASIQRTYRLFRTLGLRFLCVVNHSNQVVGIITRKDLMPESLAHSLLRGRSAHVEVGHFT